MTQPRAVNILLVEDNPDHAELTLRALKDGNMLNGVFWVKDGAEALEFLFHSGRYAAPGSAARPGLILLDLHLPKVDGHEVLRRVKTDPDLHTIPVVMLTTSAQDDEVSRCYEAGANSYVCKPVSFGDFVASVKTVKLYWVLTNLPEAPP
jgi:two-component system response regulator